MKIFLRTCLIFIILSRVAAEKCLILKADHNNKSKECETTENSSCYRHITMTNINDHNNRLIERELGCTTDCTPQYYSFTINATRYFQSKRECCSGLECRERFPRMPTRKLNGKECRPCFPVFSKDCKENSKNIKCYNHETKCMEFLLAFHNKSKPTKNYFGCAAPKFCELAETGKNKLSLEGTIISSTCCDALPKHSS